jgi:hypothetical protein
VALAVQIVAELSFFLEDDFQGGRLTGLEQFRLLSGDLEVVLDLSPCS